MEQDDRSHILIVDDSPQDIHMLLAQLKDSYRITAATSAEAALQLLSEAETPDITLMDINMPGMDGYQACQIIKESEELKDIDIIFLSGNNSTDEIIRGYDVGAIDYIVKPYTPEILMSKLERAIDNRKKRLSLAESVAMANEIAMTALSNSGNLGHVIEFLRQTFKANQIDELADNLLQSLKEFGLDGCLYLKRDDLETIAGTNGETSELEMELIQRLEQYSEPFLANGRRLFIVQKNIVVLIKNMPEDETKYGQLKDYMMIILEGANGKLEYLADQEKIAIERTKNINRIVQAAEISLKEIQSMQEKYKQNNMNILDEMVEKAEECYMTLGLSDQQEDYLKSIMSKAVADSLDLFDEGAKIDHKVRDIIESLSAVARRR